MKHAIKILLVDDCDSFRFAVRNFFSEKEGFEIIGEAVNGEEVLKLREIYDADIILMDINMPVLDGIEATKRLIWEYSKAKIIAVTMNKKTAYLLKLIHTGFRGCVFKDEVFERITDAIKTVLTGKYYFPQNIKTLNN